MDVNPVQINHYLKNESIQTNRLLELSMHLKHNFFMDIAQQLPTDFNLQEINQQLLQREQHRHLVHGIVQLSAILLLHLPLPLPPDIFLTAAEK
jgi:hypothetical protein